MAKESDPVLEELTAIKKLLVLMLARGGLTQAQIAGALGIDRTGVGRMFPKGTLSSISKGGLFDE